MDGELILGTAPTSEPVTVSEAKTQCRVDISDDDTHITNSIKAAREAFEEDNGRSLFTTTWKYILDRWPNRPYIELPRPPLASVTSIIYTDTTGTPTTWDAANYVVETLRTPGRVHLADGISWPSVTLRAASPITITYVAGWSTVAAIPQRYKQAILMMVAHWYENREAIAMGTVPRKVEFAYDSLLLMDRVYG